MTNISNISALVTIIFGLMLTDLFASVHRLIRHRRRVRWHWLPVLLTWYVLAMILKNWHGLVFAENEQAYGSGWIFLYFGHLLFLLYLVVSAVLPDQVPEEGLDLREFYFDNRRHFWGLLAAVNGVLLAYALLRPAFTDADLNWGAVLSNIVMGGINLSLARVGRPAYHAVMVLILVALMLVELVSQL